jgi:hypothetical protein
VVNKSISSLVLLLLLLLKVADDDSKTERKYESVVDNRKGSSIFIGLQVSVIQVCHLAL